LMLVTDRRRSMRPLVEVVGAAVAGGVDAVHLRERDLPAADLRNLARELARVVDGRAALLINSDLALAAELGLGAHLPEARPPTAEARRRLGDTPLLGRSVHSAAAATASIGADYLLAGSVYETVSKPGGRSLGLEGFGRIVEATWAPVLAIGGVTVERVPAVMAAGAQGVAVIGAILEAADPERAAVELRVAVDAVAGGEEMETAAEREQEPGSIQVTVNGKPVELEPETTVTDFLADKGLRREMVIVELNGTILARMVYDETVFARGDTVEVVHAVGGG